MNPDTMMRHRGDLVMPHDGMIFIILVIVKLHALAFGGWEALN